MSYYFGWGSHVLARKGLRPRMSFCVTVCTELALTFSHQLDNITSFLSLVNFMSPVCPVQ